MKQKHTSAAERKASPVARKRRALAFAAKKYESHPRIAVTVGHSKVDLHESGGAWVRAWVYVSSQDLSDDSAVR